MKFFGHVNMQQNELQNAVLPLDTSFPANPKVGQLAFPNNVLYICVSVANDLPIWVPLTKEITQFIYAQPVASDTWHVNHNLHSGVVQVQVFDENNNMILPNNIEIVDQDNVTVSLGAPMIGRASVLVGQVEGNERPQYSFEHNQTSPASSWVIQHNLGYNPIVRVFIGNQEVQPMTVTFDNINQVTVTFSTPQVGTAKLI